MTTHFNNVTPAQVLDTLRDVVSGQEDYVYCAPAHQASPGDTCFYVHTDPETGDASSPGCVVGHVLNRLGVPLSELSGYEGTRAAVVLRHLTGAPNWDNLGDDATNVGRILDTAQQCQDNGGTWGEALSRAKSTYQPA